MRYKDFGKTGEKVSVLCLGTWALGGKQFGAVPEADAISAVHAMVDNGVNIVDTAPIYAPAVRKRSSARRSKADTATRSSS